METTPEAIVEALSNLVKIPATRDEGAQSFTWDSRRADLLPLDDDALRQLTDEVNGLQENDNIAVTTNRSYEVLVELDRHASYQFDRRLRDSTQEQIVTFEDSGSGLKYEIGAPSPAYAVYLALKIQSSTQARRPRPLPMSSYFERMGSISITQLASIALRAYSIRVTATSNKPASSWGSLVDACCFHISYNLDAAVLRQRNLNELIRPLRISRVRNARLSELDAPKRTYVNDLINHYQLGVSSESPMLEYLSYYHVAEHYFESIYQKDLVEKIQDSITRPGFSHRRKSDIQQLIKTVSKAIQVRDEQVVINEQVALQLTLKEYVDVGQLEQEIRAYEPELLDHYTNNVVTFSKGDQVDLTASDHEQVILSLSRRIYKTRNSLVHSKDGAKSRFTPFADDDDLLPEVPLMRFVAEQIIIRTSSLL